MEKTIQLFEDMLQVGDKPDDAVLSHVIDGCCHANICDLGTRLFTDLHPPRAGRREHWEEA